MKIKLSHFNRIELKTYVQGLQNVWLCIKMWQLRKQDYITIFSLFIALFLFVIILFLPWTIATSLNGETTQEIGFREGGLLPVISSILMILIFHLIRQNFHIMRNDYFIPLILLFAFLLYQSFNTLYFHMEIYLSAPVLNEYNEFSHGIGYYMGLVALVLQSIGAVMALIIIRDKIKEREFYLYPPLNPPSN